MATDISLGEAAHALGVSLDTLRRWDRAASCAGRATSATAGGCLLEQTTGSARTVAVCSDVTSATRTWSVTANARCHAEWEAVNTAEYFAAVEGRGLTVGPHIDLARAVLRDVDRFGRPVVAWAARTVDRAQLRG